MTSLRKRNSASASDDQQQLNEALARAEKELKLIDLITKLVRTGVSK